MAPTTSTSPVASTTDAEVTIAPVCPSCWTVGDDGNCQPDQDKIHVTCAPSGIIVQVDKCVRTEFALINRIIFTFLILELEISSFNCVSDSF